MPSTGGKRSGDAGSREGSDSSSSTILQQAVGWAPVGGVALLFVVSALALYSNLARGGAAGHEAWVPKIDSTDEGAGPSLQIMVEAEHRENVRNSVPAASSPPALPPCPPQAGTPGQGT